jgi:hypothetical protein
MAIVKHPKNRHVMATSAKSKPYVARTVKPNRKAARAAAAQAADATVPATPEDRHDPIDPNPPE